MTQDLTKITTPYGLLDEATQKALREHGGPYEVYIGEWEVRGLPMWSPGCVYRVKPQPQKPREWWALVYSDGIAVSIHQTLTTAHGAAFHKPFAKVVHVREVLE